MDVIKRALLGDKNAQNEMTENGELLPCQCGGKAKVITRIDEEGHPFKVVLCLKCRIELQGLGDTEEKEKELITDWNTRAQLLTPEEMERFAMLRMTSKKPWKEVEGNLREEMGYSHIWQRLAMIEDVLGDEYNIFELKGMIKREKKASGMTEYRRKERLTKVIADNGPKSVIGYVFGRNKVATPEKLGKVDICDLLFRLSEIEDIISDEDGTYDLEKLERMVHQDKGNSDLEALEKKVKEQEKEIEDLEKKAKFWELEFLLA